MKLALCRPLALALTLAAAPSLGAGTLVVDDNGGPGVDFSDLAQAIAAAPEGSLLLVKDGVYGGVTISAKALTLAAEAGATVQIAGALTIQNLAANQSVALSGIDIGGTGVGVALTATSCQGPILIERSLLRGDGIPLFQQSHAALLTACADVTFVECDLRVNLGSGGVAGLRANSSRTHLYRCVVVGGAGALDAEPGGAGAEIDSGFLFASGSEFHGGAGEQGGVSSPFQICSDGGPGGPGLKLTAVVAAPPLVKALDDVFVGGAGGPPGGPACNPGPTGPATQILAGTLQTLAGEHRTYQISSPVREGQTGSIALAGAPGEFVWLFFSPAQAPVYADLFHGTLLPGQPQLVVFLGALPATGKLDIQVLVPVQASTLSFTLIEQALYHRPSTGFVASEPRLGVVLDQSL